MTLPSGRDAFIARCLRVAGVAGSAGVALRKVERRHALEIARGSASLVVPIVTDDRAWRETSVEEAFYSVLLDASTWSRVDLGPATLADLDDVERGEIPQIRRDFDEERARVRALRDLLGGDEKLAALFATADLPTGA